tara:strand:- start:1632 stop:1880 length:249 start_codon:yes stop_codon:yes gene_type:complete
MNHNEEFRKSVRKAKKLGLEIKNPSVEMAPILIEEMLDHAIENKLDIKIVTDNLDLYEPFLDKFKKAINVGCKIEVIIEKVP